jgi:hypothetical protein
MPERLRVIVEWLTKAAALSKIEQDTTYKLEVPCKNARKYPVREHVDLRCAACTSWKSYQTVIKDMASLSVTCMPFYELLICRTIGLVRRMQLRDDAAQ